MWKIWIKASLKVSVITAREVWDPFVNNRASPTEQISGSASVFTLPAPVVMLSPLLTGGIQQDE